MVVQLCNSSVNIARKIKCYIIVTFYFSEIAFIGFTLYEIKQGIVFFETHGSFGNLTENLLNYKFVGDFSNVTGDMHCSKRGRDCEAVGEWYV
jgi:hypothetical protein